MVQGRPAAPDGTIDLPLGKRTGPAGWRMVPDPAGQPARTEWRLLAATATASWLELRPRTGRTHQIRVHCATGLGCPILGDPLYGPQTTTRLHLLARHLLLPLDPPAAATAPVPAHMRAALAALDQPPGCLPL